MSAAQKLVCDPPINEREEEQQKMLWHGWKKTQLQFAICGVRGHSERKETN